MERVKAVYHNGTFIPQAPFALPEDTPVELTVHPILIEPPQIADEELRRQVLGEIVQSMMNNPIPAGAPRFTREELHARG